jgi:hypothetical protein
MFQQTPSIIVALNIRNSRIWVKNRVGFFPVCRCVRACVSFLVADAVLTRVPVFRILIKLCSLLSALGIHFSVQMFKLSIILRPHPNSHPAAYIEPRAHLLIVFEQIFVSQRARHSFQRADFRTVNYHIPRRTPSRARSFVHYF